MKALWKEPTVSMFAFFRRFFRLNTTNFEGSPAICRNLGRFVVTK